ncbi:tyrosine-type recombinase/integrase [Noviherbaspirillum autotrophicum]|uniref:Tyr recombinase domain-containing protein n=1 Tax=Noviherbaspirillum autotrophicum TaxID=709839 RepID=A0A0C2BUI3_9BURK|nr:site-specific integrase [Noviherbaspirillum autotrophicum]KIF81701.1 hypothetical protein TSA66_14325 [Noviherbaspirillum autotrophicum]
MTYPLFAASDTVPLEQSLHATFEAWIAAREHSRSRVRTKKALREESAEVYREMWHAFARFCTTRALDLPHVAVSDIEAFLATRATARQANLAPRYVRRFLTLIQWVTAFQAIDKGLPPNQAAQTMLERPEYRYANAANKDPVPEYLTDTQAKRLIAYLTIQSPQRDAFTPLPWKEVRDRAAVALMLGAGLTPGDVRHLLLSGVHTVGGHDEEVPWKLALPGNGNFPARETPLASWAAGVLADWLAVRAAQQIGGNFVFPSTRDGRQWSDTRCFLRTRDVLAAAGIASDAGGMFRLRHTFALRQLKNGKTEKEVAGWLGLLDLNAMVRYRRILTSPVDII